MADVVVEVGVSLLARHARSVGPAAGGTLRRLDPVGGRQSPWQGTGRAPGMRDGETVGRHDSPAICETSASAVLGAISGRAHEPQDVRRARSAGRSSGVPLRGPRRGRWRSPRRPGAVHGL